MFAAGSDKIRLGLIGCGARGIGAAMNCVLSTPGVEIVALGDVFPGRVEAALKQLKDNNQGKEWSCSREWKNADQVKATKDTCFTGFNAYQQVLAGGVDMVILAGPPHFRPIHLKAAIEAGKHVFMEKPVAVDPAGIRSILASSELAKQKGLAIVAGTQRRHENSYLEVMKRIKNGDIGAIVVSEARQINGTEPRVGEGVVGAKGRAYAGRIEGAHAWKWEGANPNPYEQEHADLIASIRAGKPLNEGKHVAEATLTAIMARMSAYSGKTVKWEFALKESELDLTPKEIKEGGYKLGPAPTVPPPARGNGELI